MIKNCIYRFVNNNNEIIYIGKALNLQTRINNSGHITKHLPEQCYAEIAVIEYVDFKTKNDMDFAERYYIQKYNPIYNDVHSDKPITIEIGELDTKLWFKYYIKEDEVLRQIKEFKNNNLIKYSPSYEYMDLKIDIDILDYVKLFSLQENYHFYRYKLYREFKNKNELYRLKDYMGCENLQEEIKKYENIDKLNILINIDEYIKSKIKYELDNILNNYKLLTYGFGYLKQKGGDVHKKTDWVMDMQEFNQSINLADNYFKINSLVYVGCCKSECNGCSGEDSCQYKKFKVKFQIHIECN